MPVAIFSAGFIHPDVPHGFGVEQIVNRKKFLDRGLDRVEIAKRENFETSTAGVPVHALP